MNRKLLVTLLQKDIQELEMITEGFMEMNVYPKAIIMLAKRKTEDIQSYINQLSAIKDEADTTAVFETARSFSEPAYTHETPVPAVPVFETKINTDTSEELSSEMEAALESASEQVVDEILEVEITPITKEQIIEITVPELIEEVEEPSENIADTTMAEFDDASGILKPTVIKEMNEVTEVSEIKELTLIYEPEIKTMVDDSKKIIFGEKNLSTTTSLNELLAKADTSISSALGNKKISDIKQAISIGERFRFQRELFRGNGEDMNKTLTYLNLLATFEEARSFLQSKYGWTTENETAEDFYQIVRRRFI